jgi:hypothetical protein
LKEEYKWAILKILLMNMLVSRHWVVIFFFLAMNHLHFFMGGKEFYSTCSDWGVLKVSSSYSYQTQIHDSKASFIIFHFFLRKFVWDFKAVHDISGVCFYGNAVFLIKLFFKKINFYIFRLFWYTDFKNKIKNIF